MRADSHHATCVLRGSVLKRFEVPQDKLDKLEVIPHRAADEKSITFAMLEKPAGKCTSMSVAVPPAGLYTHYIYRAIGDIWRSGGTRKSTDTHQRIWLSRFLDDG